MVETDDGLWVVKFRGAGQGPRALIAELVVGLVAAELELPVPELAVVEVPEGLADDQRDPEVRDLVQASVGVNVGLRYLDGAFNYDPGAAGDLIDDELASDVVWLDAFLTNPDRTARNPNLMIWGRRPWLIDHGSALYAHHAWGRVTRATTRAPFPPIHDHVLLAKASGLEATDDRAVDALTPDRLVAVVDAVPDALLMDPLARGDLASADDARDRYVRWMTDRLASPREFVEGAIRAREARRAEPPKRLGTRR